MNIIFPLIYIIIGSIFLLISTVFYPSITTLLMNLQEQMHWSAPPFWNLSFVLIFVRIIFIIVGIFITGFGIALFWIKK